MNIIVQPLGFILRLLYDMIGNYGLTIIVFTVIVKLALVPLTMKQVKSTKKIQEIQPKIAELQEKYKNDKEQMNIKLMELYKEHNINPLGGCLPLLIQFPIIIGLFTVLRNPMDFGFSPEVIQSGFLWIPNLSLADPWILPLFAAVTTYLSSVTMTPPGAKVDATQSMMKYFMPVMIFVMAKGFPAGLALYWGVSNLVQIGQQLVTNRPNSIQQEA